MVNVLLIIFIFYT